MRLKITLKSKGLTLPLNYQSTLQGLIYSIFDREAYGTFLHDKGYRYEKRVFKLFVFSNLFGKFQIDHQKIIFEDTFYFYIASQSEEFMQFVYEFFCSNTIIVLQNQKAEIQSLEFQNLPYFKGIKNVQIRSLSPAVAYKTEGKYVTYFKANDKEFADICYQNLVDKNNALQHPLKEINFSIQEIISDKKRLVRFKNTFYEGHMIEMKIQADYDTLMLLYNTGLSSKGPAGFGMIDVVK